MPRFRYTAIDREGKVVKGEVVVLDEKQVEQRLALQHLTLIRTSAVNQGKSLFSPQPGGKIKPRLLIEFYYRLGQALQLGMPLIAALDENARLLPSKALAYVIDELRVSIEAGNTIYDAMKRFPKVFSRLDLATIRMGEQSGNLPRSIQDLTDFLEWKENFRAIIKRATVYPSFILVTITAVLGVWVGYVLPQMAKLLQDMGLELPAITQFILSTSFFLQDNWSVMLAAMVIMVAALVLYRKTPAGSLATDRLLLRIPVIGEIVLQLGLARLCRSFAIMFASGLSITAIFDILTDSIVGNRFLEEKVKDARHFIEAGRTIADGFQETGSFPPFFIGAVRNGENSGTVDRALQRLSQYYDTEVKRTVQLFLDALEPATFILLGGVFGLIILSIMLPLYDLINQLGQSY